MPTLKEHLEINLIKATPDQRSQIGVLISSENDSNSKVLEDGWNVKDYTKNFLNSVKTSNIIIKYFNEINL